MDIYYLLDIIAAYVLDLLLGDPHRLPHPVRFIGWLVKNSEKVLRDILCSKVVGNHIRSAGRERAAGVVMTVFVVSIVFVIILLILEAARAISPVLFHVFNIYFMYSSFASRCLADEANKVYSTLRMKDIDEARKRLSMLVGRQTENLDEKEVIRGVVETTAENTVDGVMSPILYAVIGSLFGIGAPLAYAFKASSTLDSMVGYMNDRYIYLGWASARLDDAANYIPARLSGLLIPLSAAVCGKSFKRSFSIMLRDRRNHKSPNCAYPEAAVAGALGVRIGGANTYFGQTVEKPTIGTSEKELEICDITDTVRIMYVTSVMTLLIGLAAAGIVLFVSQLLK